MTDSVTLHDAAGDGGYYNEMGGRTETSGVFSTACCGGASPTRREGGGCPTNV
jgi:hypothetical protein